MSASMPPAGPFAALSAVPAAGAGSLPVRGTVEGFYGPPWSPAERLAHLRFSARVGLSTYVFAPKDDPRHRAEWRDLHPAHELDELAALVAAAHGLGIRFVYAISPGLSMRFTGDADHRALVAKARQLAGVGVVSFALFFDDVPTTLAHPEDRERWEDAGAAHGDACTRFVAALRLTEPLLVCPTDYAGVEETPYRRHFARTAPADAQVCWTGADIVVGTVTRDDIDRAAASYRRRLVLWDNFPVNDFEPSRLFVGPLTGRTTDLAGSALDGVLANPMVWWAPSLIPLVSVADWAADPAGYDPTASAARALRELAGAGADDLAPLVRACGSWPPGVVADAELAEATGRVLAGDGASDAASDAAAVVASRLTELARGCRAASEPEALVAGLRPWLDSGAAVADAGLAALGLWEAPSPRRRAETRRALDEAERHYADVLRAIVPPFVREVLARAAPPAPAAVAPGAPVALLLPGPRTGASDEAVTGLLHRRGYAVTTDAGTADPALIVVTGGTDKEALVPLAGAGVPILAWYGLRHLRLVTRTEVLIARDRLRIDDPADPLAAGLDGDVRVYLGPSKLTVGAPGPDARVVARTAEDGHPAVFHYPAGARLADGSVAPAPRIGLFLADDGLAPWVLTDAGRALVEAAFGVL